jgi:dTDP-4-dehydrorhamnose reductase
MTLANRVIVVGAAGQVGGALMAQLGDRGHAITKQQANIANRSELLRSLTNAGPAHLLINAAAYTNVDRAESEPELAHAVNGDAPGWMAEWAADQHIPFVHYSTEYVFPGGKPEPWTENDKPSPLSVYGASKLAGEQAVRAVGGQDITLRTSWVYDDSTRNFVGRVLERAATVDQLTMVSGQKGAPTYAPDLAATTLAIAEALTSKSTTLPNLLHLTGVGSAWRPEYAREIIALALSSGLLSRDVAVVEVPEAVQADGAARPQSCLLDCSLASTLGFMLPGWRSSLAQSITARSR